jgi:manganese/zinc/iron transport system substrate-binding protein
MSVKLMTWCFVILAGSLGARADQLKLVATTGMVGDVVRAVAGDQAKVQVLMGEGVDPHLYKARSSDVRAMLSADGVFYTGLLLEGRMGEALRKTADRGHEVVAVAESIPSSRLLKSEEEEGHADPHVWMDVSLWSRITGVVQDALCRIDPANCEIYKANARSYLEELSQLDIYVRMVIESIPEDQRVLVTAHDAFGYFGRAYGVEVRGIQGISTDSEAGLADINSLVRFLVERRIPAVFVESSIPEKNVRALQEGSQSAGHAVIVGGELFSDAMGRPGTWPGTYVGMMDHNATTIAGALGGHPIEGGYRAWLKSKRASQSNEDDESGKNGESAP